MNVFFFSLQIKGLRVRESIYREVICGGTVWRIWGGVCLLPLSPVVYLEYLESWCARENTSTRY